MVVAGCEGNESSSKVLNFLERLDDKISWDECARWVLKGFVCRAVFRLPLSGNTFMLTFDTCSSLSQLKTSS